MSSPVIDQIWVRFFRAQVDLFANRQNTWFSLGGDNPPLGIDALGHQWPDLRLYAFPPILLLQQVLCRVADEGRELILIAPHWPNQPWVADLVNMSVQQPWELPLRRDLLTQAHRTVWHPHPKWWRLRAWHMRGAGS